MTNAAMEFENYYASMGSFVLANGTDGAIAGGVTSLAYPTPYVGINGLILFTSLSKDGASGECLVASASEEAVQQGVGIGVSGLGSTTISLDSTYYSPIPGMVPTGKDIASVLVSFYENVGIDTSAFSAFLQSNTKLMSSFPMLASCLYQPYGFGPPAVKIPVSALTATVTSTSQINGNPPGAPVPANPVKPHIAPHTTPPEVNPGQTAPSNIPFVAKQPQTTSQALPKQDVSHSISNAAPPQDQGPPDKASSNTPSLNQLLPNPSPSQKHDVPPDGNADAPTISYAGAEIEPDKSTQYDFPGIGVIQPGGLPVTTQNVIYSLAPSATALRSNGFTEAITVAADQPLLPPQPQILTIGDSAYTIDSSSHFIIGSQTLAPGSPGIIVFGTPVSLASDASVAVIGSSTTQFDQEIVPKIAPVLTLGDTAYTATLSSAFVIAGQTLTLGGSITVSGTRVAYPTTGNVMVVGESTQALASATITPPSTPAMTFAGNTYTLDSASAFDIDGQTLTKGGAINLSGVALSYPNTGGDVIVGTSTEALGSVIMNGLSEGPSSTGSNAAAFSGGADHLGGLSWKMIGAVVGILGLISV